MRSLALSAKKHDHDHCSVRRNLAVAVLNLAAKMAAASEQSPAKVDRGETFDNKLPPVQH